MPILTRNKQRINASGYKAMTDINKALKSAMTSRNMTIEELADVMEVTPESIKPFIDNPLRPMSTKQMASIFAALNFELTIWISPIALEKGPTQ